MRTLLSTVRGWFLKKLSTELGVLGEQLARVTDQVDALADAHSTLKERFERLQNRSGMRWARSGNGVDTEQSALLEWLKANAPRGNKDFPEL